MVASEVWPAHTSEPREWRQKHRGGTRDDRTLSSIDVALPPLIAQLDFSAAPATATLSERAVAEIAYTEGSAGSQLAALGRFLTQTESVSSSKIERVEAGSEDFARALVGIKANPSAVSMVAATEALNSMVDRAGETGRIELADLLAAHAILMQDDPLDRAYAGRLRDMQNWIGGSDHSPRGAVHIPPPPELLDRYLGDLETYINRDDVPPLVQAAAAHAQFESIHPFTDGNGRIGRALINAILRRRKVTRATVVPIATAMVADREGYFALVNGYRKGHLGAFVRSLSAQAIVAAEESQKSAHRLRELPTEWAGMSRPRSGSAAERILGSLLDEPVISAESARRISGASAGSTSEALSRLEADGVLREITGRTKNKVWAAVDVTAELDDLQLRIAKRVQAAKEPEVQM